MIERSFPSNTFFDFYRVQYLLFSPIKYTERLPKTRPFIRYYIDSKLTNIDEVVGWMDLDDDLNFKLRWDAIIRVSQRCSISNTQ